MKDKSLLLLITLFLASIAHAQWSATSETKYFNIQKVVVPPILSVVDGSVKFVDIDGNNTINANETCYIRMKVQNSGRGEALGCRALINAEGSLDGLSFANQNVKTIAKGETVDVVFPIKADMNTQNGQARFTIKVEEPNGFDTQEQTLTIATHQFDAPEIRIVSYKVVGEHAGTLQKSSIFKLQMMLQNTAQGLAENVQMSVQFPENISWMGGDNESMYIPSMKPGDIQTFEFELAANNRAADEITIPVTLSEKYGKYAQNEIIPLKFGQTISGADIVVESHQKTAQQIAIGSLISDVDTNIPLTKKKNDNTFVVIVANENYQQVASVPYAHNDGAIFREYCIKTLGIPEKNIKLINDATSLQLKSQVTWLQSVTDLFEDERVIFYYAGHGIPDEKTQSSYLLPVDGIGTDATTGYSIDNLYAALGNMAANNITIFMDACFSGSKRGSGMLAQARGVALKAKSGAPMGNMVVFSAAQGDETAYPNPDEGHGMFTYYLLKKLQETQGDVTLKELGEYIITNVSRQSIVLNSKSQTPCVTPSSNVADSWQSWKLR